MATSKKIYHAAMYLRLSQEDGDVADSKKAESNSISNQKALIKQFLKNLRVVSVSDVFANKGTKKYFRQYMDVSFDLQQKVAQLCSYINPFLY